MQKKLIIEGKTGTGKTAWLINKYKSLLQAGCASEQILVLVMSRVQKMQWLKKLGAVASGPRCIMSYVGFVQRELQKYWPLLGEKQEQPFFLTLESSQYIMGRLIAAKREQGAWTDLISSNERLALEFIQNLSRAVMSGIFYGEIGERLYYSWEDSSLHNQQDYRDMQEVINEFRNLCRAKGLLDYSLVLEIYTAKLLGNADYQGKLQKRFKVLLVDDLAEAFALELDFIRNFSGECCAAWNPSGGYSRFSGAVPEEAEKMIADWPRKFMLNCYTGSRENVALGERLSERIMENKAASLQHQKHEFLHEDLNTQIFPLVARKIKRYLRNGVLPGKIAVIAPYIDNTLEFSLNYYLESTGRRVTNLVRQNSFLDNNFLQALVTLACLAHPEWNLLPPKSDLRQTYSLVLELDPLRSSLLAEATVQKKPYRLPELDEFDLRERIGYAASERYERLRSWVKSYQTGLPVALDFFWQRVLTEILIYLPFIEENLIFCRQLIESASHFLAVMEKLNEKDMQKVYITFLRSGIKGAESIELLEQKLNPTEIILTTPYVYLASGESSEVQIWLDINSDGWYATDRQEMANVHVLQRTWTKGEVFFDATDEQMRKLKMAVTCQALLARCSEAVILAGTSYSSRGYEQDGILEELMLNTLQQEVNYD